jgi:hypothetical protein
LVSTIYPTIEKNWSLFKLFLVLPKTFGHQFLVAKLGIPNFSVTSRNCFSIIVKKNFNHCPNVFNCLIKSDAISTIDLAIENCSRCLKKFNYQIGQLKNFNDQIEVLKTFGHCFKNFNNDSTSTIDLEIKKN